MHVTEMAPSRLFSSNEARMTVLFTQKNYMLALINFYLSTVST